MQDVAGHRSHGRGLVHGVSRPLAEAHARPDHAAESTVQVHHGPRPLPRLLGLLRPEWRDLGMVVVYAVGVGILSLATPITAMALVNTVALATLVQQLVILCVALLVSLARVAVIHALQIVVIEYIQRRIFARVAADLAYRLPRVDIKAFDENHGPELVNRFFDVLTVQKAGATLLLDGVALVLQTGIGLALLAAYHQSLLGFDLFLIGALLVMVFVLGRGAVDTSIRESRAKYRVAGWLEEIARRPVDFKLSGGPHFALERVDILVLLTNPRCPVDQSDPLVGPGKPQTVRLATQRLAGRHMIAVREGHVLMLPLFAVEKATLNSFHGRSDPSLYRLSRN